MRNSATSSRNRGFWAAAVVAAQIVVATVSLDATVLITVEEVLEVISAVAERLPLRAAALTAFDPEADASGAGGDAALRIAIALAEAGRP